MSNEASLAYIYDDIASAICGEKSRRYHWPVPWSIPVRAVEMAAGARITARETGVQELHEAPLDFVAIAIITWLRSQPEAEVLLSYQQAREAARVWLAAAKPVLAENIRPVVWNDAPGYTWRRLPWGMVDNSTPTWDKLFSKLTNAGSFRQWLGSLLFEQARQHQYVWVHGMGNDGKGCINRFLERVFGRSYRSKQPPSPQDKFWTYGLIGSRLVVFPDCNSQGFTSGGLFKSLSGGDPIDVEAKGKMSFTVRLGCKFLFFSNEKPNISCEDADMRRIIYCEFFEKTQKEDADPDFEKRLWEEGGPFLTKCVREYVAACPRHECIDSNREEIETWVSVGEEKFQVFFDYVFMAPRHEAYKTSQFLHDLTEEQFDMVTIKPDDMLALVQNAYPDRREQGQFRDWIYKKYGAQKKVIRRGDFVARRYVGICRKPTTETHQKLLRNMEAMVRGWKLLATPATVASLSTDNA